MSLWSGLVSSAMCGSSSGGLAPAAEEKLEHINTVTITEPCNSLACNVDAKGEPFELKKVVFYGRVKPSTQSTQSAGLYCCVSANRDEPNYGTYLNLPRSLMSLAVHKEFPKIFGCGMQIFAIEDDVEDEGRIMIISGVSPNFDTGYLTGIPKDVNGIRSVVFTSSNSSAFMGVGTTIKIYGVRA